MYRTFSEQLNHQVATLRFLQSRNELTNIVNIASKQFNFISSAKHNNCNIVKAANGLITYT